MNALLTFTGINPTPPDDVAVAHIRELEMQVKRLKNRNADLQRDIDAMAFDGYEFEGAKVDQAIVIRAVERLVETHPKELEKIVRGIFDAYNEQEHAHLAALSAEDREYQWRDEL